MVDVALRRACVSCWLQPGACPDFRSERVRASLHQALGNSGRLRHQSRRTASQADIASVAVIGAVAAGGAAFTASNAVPSSVAGYGTASVTGGTVTSLTYGLSTDGSLIDTATIVFDGDLTADTVSIGFNDTTTQPDTGNGTALQTCGTGTASAGSTTTFVCTLSGVTTAGENESDIAVTGPSTS